MVTDQGKESVESEWVDLPTLFLLLVLCTQYHALLSALYFTGSGGSF